MSFSLLSLGFMLGMRHALETDHVAAMASLVTRSGSMGDSIRQGAVWGAGHTLTLFVFGSVVLLLDTVMPEKLAQGLEFMVGLMLVGLGIDVLRRLQRDRIHIHLHRHADGQRHFHAHSHAGERGHAAVHHHHHQDNRGRFPLRALFVGIMHGMAGSSILILLTLQSVHSPLTGMVYILLFGVGSIAGMAILSAIIAVPLRYSITGLHRVHNGLRALVGVATLSVGGMMLYDIGITGGLLV
jgi:ABC-type nickel/cobalt efflux system permease component RcnA